MITIKSSSYTNSDYDFLLNVFLHGISAICNRDNACLCEKCQNKKSCYDLHYAIGFLTEAKMKTQGKIDK